MWNEDTAELIKKDGAREPTPPGEYGVVALRKLVSKRSAEGTRGLQFHRTPDSVIPRDEKPQGLSRKSKKRKKRNRPI